MSFHFSYIFARLSSRFVKKNVPEPTKTKKIKKSKKPSTPRQEDVGEPLSASSSHTVASDHAAGGAVTSTAAAVAAAVAVQALPYAQYVTLSPEEMKFHCQVRVMAHEVKYSMVTTVINSWEKDLKVIPGWETIGGELLLRK